MPEAEDLLINAARHATVAAQGVWQRWRADHVQAAQVWLLEDCRQRLGLLIEAVLGMRLPVRVAQPLAPVSWAARLLGRASAPSLAALPANDGSAIFLPPQIEVAADARGTMNCRDYPVLALLQALRCARGSIHCYGLCGTPLAAELYLLAEAVAADRALRHLLPGWSAALDFLYARCAELLADVHPRNAGERAVRAMYRALLVRPGAHAMPLARTPRDSLDWAAAHARLLAAGQSRERYRPWLADPVVGRMLAPEAAPAALPANAYRRDGQSLPPQRARLERRPRARASKEDEDDASHGMWMVQTSEPHEHAEDPFGLNRPQERDAEGDVEGAAQSLAELESARLVSAPGRSAQVLVSSDAPPRLERADEHGGIGGAFAYPEWDHLICAYRAQAVRVHVAKAASGLDAWAENALQRHASTLCDVRRRLGAIRPHRQILRRRPEGEDIDCDALVDERSERRAGGTPAGAIYQQHRAAPRRIGLLLLIDASASTDAWVADGRRVIDVEKEAALVAACALDMTSIDFAVLSFSGEGARGIEMRGIKDFDQMWNRDAMRRIAALEPDRYTRLGGAVRHACSLLARRAADFRLLLLFSDGKPNDCDHYAGSYGLEDARQALIEARLLQIEPYCFTVDREGSSYLPHLFGAGHYTVVRHAQQLPLAFVEWLRHAARRASR